MPVHHMTSTRPAAACAACWVGFGVHAVCVRAWLLLLLLDPLWATAGLRDVLWWADEGVLCCVCGVPNCLESCPRGVWSSGWMSCLCACVCPSGRGRKAGYVMLGRQHVAQVVDSRHAVTQLKCMRLCVCVQLRAQGRFGGARVSVVTCVYYVSSCGLVTCSSRQQAHARVCRLAVRLPVVMRLFVCFDTWQPSNQSSFLVAAHAMYTHACRQWSLRCCSTLSLCGAVSLFL